MIRNGPSTRLKKAAGLRRTWISSLRTWAAILVRDLTGPKTSSARALTATSSCSPRPRRALCHLGRDARAVGRCLALGMTGDDRGEDLVERGPVFAAVRSEERRVGKEGR